MKQTIGKYREDNGMSSSHRRFIKNRCGQVSQISFYNTVNTLWTGQKLCVSGEEKQLRDGCNTSNQAVPTEYLESSSQQFTVTLDGWMDGDIFYMYLSLNLLRVLIINKDAIEPAENQKEGTLGERINISNVLEK